MRNFAFVVLGGVVSAAIVGVARAIIKRYRDRKRAEALELVFENTDKPPYLIEVEFTEAAPLLGENQWLRMTRRCYRVGVTSRSDEPIPGARVIVEDFKTPGGEAPGVMVKGYALRLSEDNDKDAATIPSGQSAMPVFFDLAEQFEDESGEPSDWGWLCFRNTNEPQPSIPFGKSLITLRVEAESGARPQRAKFWLQTRTPRAETLGGERDVRRTRLLVRKE